MYGGKTEARAKGGKEAMVAGRSGFGGDADGGLGGRTDVEVGGDGRDRDGDGRLIKWEYTVADITLDTEHNAPFAHALVLEIHHPIMITLGAHGGKLDRKIEMMTPFNRIYD